MRDGAYGDVVDGVNVTVCAAVVRLQSTVTCCPHEDAALSFSTLTTPTIAGRKKTVRLDIKHKRQIEG